MPQHPTCVVCNATRPNLQGICSECEGCMATHCQCNPCSHGQERIAGCVFCNREPKSLLDAVVQADDIEADLRWLMGPSEEMS